MPPVETDSSIGATVPISGKQTATGPKYNEDANLLEEINDEEIDEIETEEEDPASKDQTDADDEKQPELETDEDKKPDIPFDRPTIKEIKTKYPDLFKDFPQLKDSYFREIEFTKLFPTAEDAREAFSENEAFSALSESALAGDPAPLIDSISKTDSKAFEVFSMSFLPALLKKETTLYNQVVTPLLQNMLQSFYGEKDENTKNAALVLAEWLFGQDGEAVAKRQKSVARNMQLTEEQKRLKDESEQRTTTAFRASAGRVQDTINRGLESLVVKSPTFDPNKVFSPSLRKMGAQEVTKRLMTALSSDSAHMAVMSARWKRARANGYTSDDESKIVSTYLARAKSLIPGIAMKVSDAMLGTKRKAAEDKSDKARVFPKQNNSGAAAAAASSGKSGKDYSKMSDMDILND